MPSFDVFSTALLTLLVTISPHSLAPLFLVLTRGMNTQERNQVAMRSSVIATLVLFLFAIFGIAILAIFGITIAAFRVAGGLLLFFIAFEMIFEKRQQRREQSTETAITKDM
ncbi:MAG: MarC family protein, partial [Rhizobiaceae bacterium]